MFKQNIRKRNTTYKSNKQRNKPRTAGSRGLRRRAAGAQGRSVPCTPGLFLLTRRGLFGRRLLPKLPQAKRNEAGKPGSLNLARLPESSLAFVLDSECGEAELCLFFVSFQLFSTLYQNFTRISSRFHQNSIRISLEFTRISPELRIGAPQNRGQPQLSLPTPCGTNKRAH